MTTPPDRSEFAAPKRRVSVTAALNVGGQAIPALAALLIVPALVHRIGLERFGLLTLAWAALGYVGLFDIGTGRALTRLLAAEHDLTHASAARLIGTSLIIATGVTIVATVALYANAPGLAATLARDQPALRDEIAVSIRCLSLALPIAAAASILRAVLEGHNRFATINAITVPHALANYYVPFWLVTRGHGLPAIMCSLAAARALALLAFALTCREYIPHPSHLRWEQGACRTLLAFGGWATASSVVAPLILQTDRVLLAGLSSLGSLGNYAIPAEAIGRASIIPGAFAQVLFPVLSRSFAIDRQQTRAVLSAAATTVFGTVYPVALLAVAVAPEWLRLWLGNGASTTLTGCARLLIVAMFVNSLATIPFTAIQAAGKPQMTGALHVVEFPLYVILSALMIRWAGALGAAFACLLRASFDALLLYILSGAIDPGLRRRPPRLITFVVPALALSAFAIASAQASLPARLAFALSFPVALAALAWMLKLLYRIPPRLKSPTPI